MNEVEFEPVLIGKQIQGIRKSIKYNPGVVMAYITGN